MFSALLTPWLSYPSHFQSLSAVLANQGGPSWLEVKKCDACLQEGPEEGSGELQACQSDLGAGEDMEQIIFSAITRHVRDNQLIRPSHHGFMGLRYCWTNLISFYDKLTHSVDEGKAEDIVYLDLSKAFDTFPQQSPGENGCSWHGWAYVLQGENWLDGQAPRVVVNGVKSGW